MSNALEREISVLAPGIMDGAQKAAQETWSGLVDGAHDFTKNPLSATTNYVKNHAVDFAMGAAIGALSPRGLADKLLVAWSMRGIALSTLDAAIGASDPNANINDLRKNYSSALAEQGHDFVSSIPMTMLGGMAGRGTANVVFGKDNTAWDVLSGKVKPAEMSDNLRAFENYFANSRERVLLTDMDDTLFPLKGYLANSLKQNVGMISEKMQLPDQTVINALGPERMHPWFLEQSPLARQFKGTPEQFEQQIVRPFWANDTQAMKGLTPFNGVPETLQTLRDHGVKIVALTNAPMPWAIRRLTSAHLDGYIDHLYAMKAPEPSATDVLAPSSLEHGRELSAAALNSSHKIGELHYLEPGTQKPDLGGLTTVLRDQRAKPNEIVSVGDNRDGDGAAPEYFGVPFAWARYGREGTPPEAKQFLNRFKPRHDATEPEPPPIEHKHPVTVANLNSYSEILNQFHFGRDWTGIRQTLLGKPNVSSLFVPTAGFNLIGRLDPTSDKHHSPA